MPSNQDKQQPKQPAKKGAPLDALCDGGKSKQLRIENVLTVAGPATVAPTVVTYPVTVAPTVVTPTVVTSPAPVTDTFCIEVCPHYSTDQTCQEQ